MANTKVEKVRIRTTEEVLSEIIRASGGILFLSRLLRWWPHAKREEKGKRWIYKPRKDWCREIGVELKTFERHITTLRREGWIETDAFERVGPSGMPYGLKIQHVRPTEKLLQHIAEGTGKRFDRDQTSPQEWGTPPLISEGHPPSKMGDQYKDPSGLYKKKQKKEHKSGTVQTNDATPPVSPLFGKKEDAPTAHPEGPSIPPKPPGSAKRFIVLSGEPEDIADPLALL